MISEQKKIGVIQYGLGSIGSEMAKLVTTKPGLDLLGGVDLAEDKLGKNLSKIIGVEKILNSNVVPDLKQALDNHKGDVVLHATKSSLKDIEKQLSEALEMGMNVISTSEELSFPWIQNPECSMRLDKLAKRKDVSILGVGINPGLILDSFVLALTGICADIEEIIATRVVDASTRRLPLQRKIGAGITTNEFQNRVDSGTIGHVGLIESFSMICEGLGLKVISVENILNPVIAKEDVNSKYIKVNAGQVTGIEQRISGMFDKNIILNLNLRMYLGAQEPYDEIIIKGTPNLNVRFDGGISGDLATAAIAVNSIPRILNAPPGLITAKDLPMASAILGDVKYPT